MIHDTQSAQTSQKQDGRNIYAIIKTMCPPGYHHSGFVATHALGHMKWEMGGDSATFNIGLSQLFPANVAVFIRILAFVHNSVCANWRTHLKHLRNQLGVRYGAISCKSSWTISGVFVELNSCLFQQVKSKVQNSKRLNTMKFF